MRTGMLVLSTVLLGTIVLAACGNTEPAMPGGSDSTFTTPGPGEGPGSTYWTDERLQSAEPEDMPTVP
jgi:ABC-type glycerol-3-phosphate transport system substrate-binding protein